MSESLRLVNGTPCPCPSSCSWGLQDNSAEDAGRVQDGNDTMHKNRTTQKRKLNLSWNNPDPETVATVLQLFNPEYVNVTYHDAMSNAEETRSFYVGDRTAPMKIWTVGNKRYESLSFNIIER